MKINEQQPQYMTSAELEEAIKLHREQVRKLLAEARSRRGKAVPTPLNHQDQGAAQ